MVYYNGSPHSNKHKQDKKWAGTQKRTAGISAELQTPNVRRDAHQLRSPEPSAHRKNMNRAAQAIKKHIPLIKFPNRHAGGVAASHVGMYWSMRMSLYRLRASQCISLYSIAHLFLLGTAPIAVKVTPIPTYTHTSSAAYEPVPAKYKRKPIPEEEIQIIQVSWASLSHYHTHKC